MQRQEQWRHKLFRVLGEEFGAADIEPLVAGVVVEPFPRRAILYSPGDISEQVYFLLSGVLMLSAIAPDGAAIVIQLLRPGALFGYSAFLPSRERQFRAEALTDVEVAAMSRDHFASALAKLGPAGHAILIARFADTVARLGRRQMELVSLTAEERLLRVLEEIGSDFGAPDARGIVIDLRLTQETLAMIVGASRQRINTALSELCRRGRISRDGARIVLLQPGTQAEDRPAVRRRPAP